MNFRLATSKDTSNILKIYKENHISSGGQLVSEFSCHLGLTYVAEVDHKIIAYINVMEQLPERITTETKMMNQSYCFPQKALYIRQTAVGKAYQSKGVGKESYKALQKLYPNTPLYAFVHLANVQSMNFHVRNDFLPIGVFAVPKFYETHNYTAFLLTNQNTDFTIERSQGN